MLPKSQRRELPRPQLNDIMKNGVQRIELNRGCKRQCPFCWADPNFVTFPVPEIKSNRVQVIGEGILYDPDIKQKIEELGKARVDEKFVYYGLSQGIDFRLLDKELAELLSKNRFGVINNKGRWYKGIRFAWDGGLNHEELSKKTIDLFTSVGYKNDRMRVFVLILWKIPYEDCIYKLQKLREWNVMIDDCTWNTTKKVLRQELRQGIWTNQYWTAEQYENFRKKARKHNQLVLFRGHDSGGKMARRFEEVMDLLEYNELMRFKSDIDGGSIKIKKLLEEKIKSRLKEHEKVCSTCSSELSFYRTSNYTLIFGPDDFKKKASFCGLDCLEYFILKLKNIKNEKNIDINTKRETIL